MGEKLKIKLDDGATLPRKAHASDIGYDLTVCRAELEFVVLPRPDYVPTDADIADASSNLYELVKVPLEEYLSRGSSCLSPVGGWVDPRPRRLIVDTGVHVEPPSGYWVEVAANSRVVKLGLSMANSVGIIDPDYRGSIRIFFTITDMHWEPNNLRRFLPGNVCAQMILRRAYEAEIVQTEELSDTVRGAGGFGSTAE